MKNVIFKNIMISLIAFVTGTLASFFVVAPAILEPVESGSANNLEINFMMLGNGYAGDSIYIKAGETDILVDAGSRKSSAKFIKDYITDSKSNLHSYVEDNKLEYVIATHADQDHIAAFVGSDGILKDSSLEIETIIEFPRTNKTTAVYKEYRQAVSDLKANGTNVYTALDCYNNQNGASRVIELSEGIEELDNCFQACEKLKKVILPNSLKRITNECFANCSNLSKIKLPDNLELIGG